VAHSPPLPSPTPPAASASGVDAAGRTAVDIRRDRLFAIVAWTLVGLAYAEFVRHALKYAYPPDQTKGDFLAFYEAARDMVHGGDLYVQRHRNYIYPPLVAFLYMPLTWLDDPATQHRAAGIISLLLSAAMSIASAWLLARDAGERLAARGKQLVGVMAPVITAVALVVVADKVRSELRMWQTNALMLFLIAIGIRFLDRRPALAGIALGLAVNVKYLPIFFLPWLLVRRRFRAAGGMAAGILIGAFLPALWVGWTKNLEYLRVGFGGLLALVGIDPGTGEKAVTQDIADSLSVSITSVLARSLGGADHARLALAISGLIALGVCALIVLAYRRSRLPLIAWPSALRQQSGPFPAMVAMEMAALIVGLLVFSPQTNPRHLYLLLAPACAAAAMIVAPMTSWVRWPAIIGCVLLFCALVLPPGGTEHLDAMVRAWRECGGPSYGMLALLAALVWSATRTARAAA
jgi:hypothetical protein